MPFVTDHTWTPSTYRKALTAWQINNPPGQRAASARKAAATSSPRLGELSQKLKSLLTWRTITRGSDWTAANDNSEPGSVLVDCDHTIRPRIPALFRALSGMDFEERRHARIGGGGAPNVVPVGGEIEHGKVMKQKGRKPDCVVRMGTLYFSNGGVEERALIRDEVGRISMGAVRIPLGGLVRVGPHKAYERFSRPKGAANDNSAPANVGMSASANRGAYTFDDPVADADEAAFVRSTIKPETAAILDLALVAANLQQIGERLGHSGKHAERKGKQALISACEELDAILAA
ncbi:hypothetical protein JZX86_18105 [Agrobacterium rosae]|uniref:hypothetical protein n=1 Tax=Agrobacterium rosae TaxID=1972867 RepID=UPI0019D39294|nr:hypothetical protein [Agrobacterium rosae]MBN7807270.1 hypothetical protein [Agrobacterium rosae]